MRPIEPPQSFVGNAQRANFNSPSGRVVVFKKVTDNIGFPNSPSMPRVTPLQPVLMIPMSDPSAAAAQQILYQQRRFAESRHSEQSVSGNDAPGQCSSHPQISSEPLQQGSNSTNSSANTSRSTSKSGHGTTNGDRTSPIQVVPCPVTLTNFKSCEYCNKRFRSLICAKIHYWVDHQQLPYNRDLLLPFPRISQQEIDSRVCPYCRLKLLGGPDELFETHILTHLQLMPYICVKCLFPAVSPGALEKHSCFAGRILPLKREMVEPVIPIQEQKFEVKIEQKPTVTLCHDLACKGDRS